MLGTRDELDNYVNTSLPAILYIDEQDVELQNIGEEEDYEHSLSYVKNLEQQNTTLPEELIEQHFPECLLIQTG